jgi:hypothetical protein
VIEFKYDYFAPKTDRTLWESAGILIADYFTDSFYNEGDAVSKTAYIAERAYTSQLSNYLIAN